MDLLNQPGEIQVAALAPGALQHVRQQNALAALHRIGLDAHQPEQSGHRGADALAEQFAVLQNFRRRHGEGLEDGNRQTRAAARRVEGEIRRGAQPPDAFAVLIPTGQALAPKLGLLRGELGHGHALLLRVVLVDPGREILRAQLGKRQHQVAEVALGINDDGRDAVDGGLLDDVEAEAGLAAAGHAHDQTVRDQVLGVVEHQLGQALLLLQIVVATEIKHAELLVVLHGGKRLVVAMVSSAPVCKGPARKSNSFARELGDRVPGLFQRALQQGLGSIAAFALHVAQHDRQELADHIRAQAELLEAAGAAIRPPPLRHGRAATWPRAGLTGARPACPPIALQPFFSALLLRARSALWARL